MGDASLASISPAERAKLRELGRRIRIRRTQKELNQTQLAALVGFTRNGLSRTERSASPTNILRIIRIANALDTPVEEFFTEERPAWAAS